VVIVCKDQGDKHLAAYVVPREGKTLTANELRTFLSDQTTQSDGAFTFCGA